MRASLCQGLAGPGRRAYDAAIVGADPLCRPPPSTSDPNPVDKTFVKGLTLLERLASAEKPRGVTSLSKDLGLTKSNIYRLLSTLVALGYARQVERNGDYELTPKIWEMGIRVGSRIDVVKAARPDMEQLADQTGEAVHLSILDGTEVLYLDKIESRQPIAAYTRVGGRAPAWCVATGKAMLAHRLTDVETLRPLLRPFTPHSIVDMDALLDEFAEIRRAGWAMNRGEWREGVHGLAAPLRDARGQVVASVGISGPGTRFKAKQVKDWSKAVMAAAATISASLGYRNGET